MAMIFRENVYGILKRLNFIDEIIREHELSLCLM